MTKTHKTKLTPAQQFFFEHAGYSYDPKTETPEAGKLRCAMDLAAAEEFAQELEWTYEWQDDECIGCDCGSENCACSSGTAHESLCCILRSAEPSCYDSHGRPKGGAVLASLGAICEPSREYRRVVEAELASEAMTNELAIAKMMAS